MSALQLYPGSPSLQVVRLVAELAERGVEESLLEIQGSDFVFVGNDFVLKQKELGGVLLEFLFFLHNYICVCLELSANL